MGNLEMLLGSKIGVKEIKEIARRASSDGDFNEQLFKMLFHSNGNIARNAGWAISHLDDFTSYYSKKQELENLVMSSKFSSVRRLAMVVLNQIPYSEEDVNSAFLDKCLSGITAADEEPGSKSLFIKLAYKQCKFFPELDAELKAVLGFLQPELCTPAVICAKNQVLKQMKANKN